jgi:hypothetical protein
LAENQMSLPQIVSHYTNFIQKLSLYMVLLIGIDEMDKLRSDESAERFLNEIKVIFGLKDVFYIISVSENAMSSFERRGLPFRDVFDSSFDKIVCLDYLDQEGAKQLMWKRVIGLPIPFLSLCYCMSGGLARDLIRISRDMLELIPTGQKKPLSEVTRSLIMEDLKAKLRAVSISAKSISLEPDKTQFLNEVHQLGRILDQSDLSLGNLLGVLNSDCFKLFCSIEGKGDRSDDANEKHQKIAMIKEELKIYFYFSFTLLDFFEEGNRDSIEDAFSKGRFNLLAEARQNLAIGPCISQSLITEFRNLYNDVYDNII